VAYQRTKYPPWSWSSSRKSTFRECKRKYYYNYYGAHNGWESSAPEEAKQAYRLKNLDGIYLILGSAVHEIAEFTCKIIDSTSKLPEEAKLIDKIRDNLNRAYAESKNPETWYSSPKQNFMLQEFYYGDGLSGRMIKLIKERMRKAVPNLLTSKSISEIIKDKCEIKIAESMDTFMMGNTAVYAIPDLVYKDKEGNWIVVDWKTGKEYDSHPAQITVYAIYIMEKFNIKAEDIKGRVEYLLTGHNRDVEITPDTVKKVRDEITESIKNMRKYLEDVEENIPGSKEKFPITGHTRFCKWCNFYEMCKEELESKK
jgi:CRISPR/Cas system-associated exonuclease Cas4 (RecB family)